MPTMTQTARLEARISRDLHAKIKRAAELQGRTMTDFVISTMYDAAQQTIEQAEIMQLSVADQHCFAEAFLSPPDMNPALQQAFSRHSELLEKE